MASPTVTSTFFYTCPRKFSLGTSLTLYSTKSFSRSKSLHRGPKRRTKLRVSKCLSYSTPSQIVYHQVSLWFSFKSSSWHSPWSLNSITWKCIRPLKSAISSKRCICQSLISPTGRNCHFIRAKGSGPPIRLKLRGSPRTCS